MTRLSKPTEHDIQIAILEYLTYTGHWVIRVNSGAFAFDATETSERRWFRSVPRGCPDIIGCSPSGRFIAVEVKAPGKRTNLTKAQALFLKEVERRGGIAICAQDLDDVIIAISQEKT